MTVGDLKRAYKKAVDGKKESFVIDGHELLVSYAKYLIEYLVTVRKLPTTHVIQLKNKGEQ